MAPDPAPPAAPDRPAGDPTADEPSGARRAAHAAAIGAVAGAVATLAMSAVMLPARWLGLLGTQPPRRISDRLLHAAGKGSETPEPARRVGTAVVHVATGAACGALFGLVRSRTPREIPAAVAGPGFGAAVWSGAYVVAAPALELFPPPPDDRPGRPQVMFAAHLVYGFVTAALFDHAIETRSGSRPVEGSSGR